MRKLGSVQRNVLASLKSHGSWTRGCGWLWDSLGNTQRIMDSLVRAGYVTTTFDEKFGQRRYRPADPDTVKPTKRAVLLSGGRAVDGDDVRTMLDLQHRLLLKLSGDLAEQGHGEGSAVQATIADANMLGLEVAERWEEL